MLQQLSIRNLALIDALDLDFGPGLNIVTGETGAGKSILIGALSLVLGERADRDRIRRGADRCEITAIFRPPGQMFDRLTILLDEMGLAPCEDGLLLVRRVIATTGSRCFINGTPTTAQTLRSIGDLLIEVHGPYEHQALLQPARQLELLDVYAGLQTRRSSCAAAWRSWQQALQAVADARADAPSPDRREILRFQLDEIRKARLQPEEETELRQKHAMAANCGELISITSSAAALLQDDGGACDALRQVVRLASRLATINPETGEPVLERIELIQEELSDMARDLARTAERLEADPAELQRLESRLALLQKLKRKYGGSIPTALSHAEECEAALGRMDNYEDFIAACEATAVTAEKGFRQIATELTRLRRKAAPGLASQISNRLRHLGFHSADFAVAIEGGTDSAQGCDRAEMHFAPNPGEGLRPLRQIASSGEIARVMLAIKAVLASCDDTPLLVFDEIDANIGGEVANRVGSQMRLIAADRQVLAISHLPQVAAAAHHHYCVAKEVSQERTFARIFLLAEADRGEEIARMLGGRETSSVVLDHARELIANHRIRP